jgi:hypothetical protein
MNATLVIARRELAEKKFVFTAAVALAVIVSLMPLVPGIPAGGGRAVTVIASAILGVGFVLGLAAILGATMVGRELSEKRLSFYFSKPIPAVSVWTGKLIAAAILLTGTFLIVSLPSFFAGKKVLTEVWAGEGRSLIPILAIIVTAFFFAGHILSTIARARSPWAFVDLVAAGALAFLAWLVARPLVDAMAFDMLGFISRIASWLLLVVALFAGAFQLSVGRSDRQRSHLALMRFLWPAIAVVIAISGAGVAWVVSANLTDLTGNIYASNDGRSDYAIITGEARNRRDYHPAFLTNLATGEAERLGGASPFFGVEFVEGGKKLLVFRQVDRKSGATEVFVRDLRKGSPEEATGLTITRWQGSVMTTADARRIAYISNGILTAYDVDSRRALGSVKVPANEIVRDMWFASPDVLRLHTLTGGGMKPIPIDRAAMMYEFDLKTRAFRKTGEHHHMSTRVVSTFVSPDRTKVIIRDGNGGSIVADSMTLAPLATIPGVERVIAFTDGRFAALAQSTLRVFSPSGREERAIAVPAAVEEWRAREIGPGKMIISVKETVGPKGQGWRVLIVDINTGAILRNELGMAPIGFTGQSKPMGAYQLFESAEGNIVMWNPLTNEKKVLIDRS